MEVVSLNLRVGDVFVLMPAKSVLERGKGLTVSGPDARECVIEAIRPFKPGAEDDHFEDGMVIDCSPLMTDGSYDHDAPMYTIAVAGDFREDFIQRGIVVIRHMRRTFIRD
jgi:hypothetical protein